MADTITAPPTPTTEPFGMADYCHHCVRSGCARVDTITDPFALQWRGGATPVVALYACPCGHSWSCCWSRDYLADDPTESSQ